MLWVGVLAWVLHRERPTPTAFVVVPIVLLGVALVGGVGGSGAFGTNPGLGAVLALGAGLCFHFGWMAFAYYTWRLDKADKRITADYLDPELASGVSENDL